jgi:hypothetical protein
MIIPYTITVTNLNIIHRPVFHLKFNVSESGVVAVFRWNLLSWAQQVQLVSVSIGTELVGSTWRLGQILVSETLSFK